MADFLLFVLRPLGDDEPGAGFGFHVDFSYIFTDNTQRNQLNTTKEATFDVDLHEAIAQLPAPCDEMKGKVMDCTLTGYKLNEKVIRHAQVVVGL